MNNEKIIWDFLKKNLGNEYGTAALMGNLRAESALNPKNLQDTYNKAWGVSDDQFTAMVDSGQYDFCCNNMGAWGYGLAQWTSVGRRKSLYAYKCAKKTSIGDLNMQLEFLINELISSYKHVYDVLISATSIREASDVVLKKFEIPADQSENMCKLRASYGQSYYDKYADHTTASMPVNLYRVKTEKGLNVRTGPGTNYKRLKTLKNKTIIPVTSKSGNWGYVPAHSGWVCLDYTETL